MNGSAGYRVLKLGCDRTFEIYDSITKCWSHLKKIPICIKELDDTISNIVSIDTTLYFKHKDPEGISSCDTSTGVWTQHLIQVPLHSSDLTLVESDGRIMLVGLIGASCLCIWEVQKMTFLLKEVDRVRFSGLYGRPLTCWGNKCLLFSYLKSTDMYRMITYNISTRKWVKVFMPFISTHVEDYFRMRGTAFQPCLSAMP